MHSTLFRPALLHVSSLGFLALLACGSTPRPLVDMSVGADSGAADSAAATAGSDGGSRTTGGDATTAPAPKRVFVTSTMFGGDLGGVDGADAKCGTAAQAAMLGGVWKAWTSSSTEDAIDRISDVGPWYLVDGKTRVFNNKANLLTAPLAPISLDETGHAWDGAPYYGAWSGTSDQGTRDTGYGEDYCLDWTSGGGNDYATTGDPASASQSWGGGGAGAPCSNENSLVCFEQ